MKRYLLAGTSALALLAGAAGAHADPFNFTGGPQTFTVSTPGIYDITAFGAQGGSGKGAVGGNGAEIGGDFSLTAGEALQIAVGGAGNGSGDASGGGGGSFVIGPGNTPLVIAGGGGGGGYKGGAGGAGGAGGTGGSGGGGDDGGGGGGGFAGPGLDGTGQSGYFGFGGGAFPGLAFGAGGSVVGGGAGGFGGGGGGYSGGGGAYTGGGGGGGSFDAGSAPVMSAGVRSGDGYVTIDFVSAAVPEPGSLGLFASALIGLGLIRRRQRG